MKVNLLTITYKMLKNKLVSVGSGEILNISKMRHDKNIFYVNYMFLYFKLSTCFSN